LNEARQDLLSQAVLVSKAEKAEANANESFPNRNERR
jgi:hypothetical protein